MSRIVQDQERADVLDPEPEIAPSSNEHKPPDVRVVVNAVAARCARRRGHQPNGLVVADRLQIDTRGFCKLSGCDASRLCEHVWLDSVVATGGTVTWIEAEHHS